MSEDDLDVPDNPDAPTGHPRARASVELAERFAELLRVEDSHQLGVCGQLGLAYSTYKTWMADDPEATPEIAAFRRIVLAVLDERRRADLSDARRAVEDAPGTHVATVWNMRKFAHESRFKRFYADEPARVELTGKDGGAVELDLRSKPIEELVALMLAADQVKRGREDGEDEG